MKLNKRIFAFVMTGVMALSAFTAFGSTNNGGQGSDFDFDNTVESGTKIINITNTHEPERIDITVDKVWSDNDNQDGIRPDEITVWLMNGDEEVEYAVLSEETGWQCTFDDLYKYEDGEPINYTIKEDTVDKYTAVITGDMESGFTITNTHTADTFTIEGTKIWNDDNDRDGIRPGEVVIKLFADGKDTGKTATASVESNWEYEFTDLAKYQNGKEITYSIQEVPVGGYTAEYVVE